MGRAQRSRLLFLLGGVLLLGGCAPSGTEGPLLPATLRGPGALGPVILSPRHRLLSSTPPVRLMSPGWGGKIEVTLRRHDGRTRVFHSGARHLSWPEGWPPLRPGEDLEIEARVGRLVDRTLVRRGPQQPPRRALRGGVAGAKVLLRAGYPFEALERAGPGFEETREALFRAGYPPTGLRRPRSREDWVVRPRADAGPGGW